MGLHEHKKNALKKLNIGIITVSTTRSLADDKSGRWMVKRAKKEGHNVIIHRVVGDNKELIARTVWEIVTDKEPNILLLTGGTGLNPTDVTIEASAAILSRATAGVISQTTVFCLPGSLNACKLACKALIFPEAGHIAAHVNMEL